MSDLVTDKSVVLTANQPQLHTDNILAHPGSSWAGAGIVAMTAGQLISTGSMPTTTTGWVMFVVQIALAIAAALGK